MYLLSPIINAFIETRSERQVRYTVIGFFAFEFIYGWIFPEGSGNIYTFNNGYSALSLIGLYILARYLRVFIYDQRKRNRISKAFTMGATMWLSIWASIIIFDVVLWCFTTYMGIGQLSSRIFTYTSPMIIIQSIAMFMFFKNIKLRSNRFVNWLGASSLAVLIVHGYLGCEPFLSKVRYIYQSFDGLLCIVVMFLFMLAVYILAVVIDQFRIVCWNKLSSLVPDIRI